MSLYLKYKLINIKLNLIQPGSHFIHANGLQIIIVDSRKMAETLDIIKEGTCIHFSRSVFFLNYSEDIRLYHWNLEHFPFPANVATE